MRHFRKLIGTVALTPGGMSAVTINAGKNLLCDGLDIVVRTTMSVTAAYAGVKMDAAGFAIKSVAIQNRGQNDWREPGWSAFAGSIERQREYASLQIDSNAYGLGSNPTAAIGNKVFDSSFVVDFSTPDSVRPKDSALDLDALGPGQSVEVQLVGAAVEDFYLSGGAGTGVMTSQVAYVYGRFTRETGVRGAAGVGNWRPPTIKKRKTAYTLSLVNPSTLEQKLPTGGLLRGFVMRQSVNTIGPVFSAVGRVRVESMSDVFVDSLASDLITAQNREYGKRLFPYGIWDATAADGSGLCSIVDAIDTVSEHPSPTAYFEAGGFAGSSLDVVVTDYVRV